MGSSGGGQRWRPGGSGEEEEDLNETMRAVVSTYGWGRESGADAAAERRAQLYGLTAA